jgi:WD40 repeat protein
MPLESGALLLDRYRIDRVLGHGGMGAVYLATDESLGIPCAIKENLNLSPESERQFKREATLLASLRHPNLPRVTNHFVLGNQQYLVMDFVEGEDLKERLEQEGRPLDEADVLRWGEQICYALTYLHGLNPPIVHRDIKPANIKITPAGEAMLVDFGIAKAGASGQKTTTGAVGLTSGYAPPEQYGTGRTDARTDEYALAATLYTLLTGQAPPDSVERLLGNKTLTPIAQLRSDLSPHVAAAITRAMEINPDNRFPSVGAFQDVLLGRVPVEPIPAPAAETVSPPATGEAALPTQAGATAPAGVVTIPGEQVEVQRRRLGCGWVFSAAVIFWVVALVALVVSPIGPTEYFFPSLISTVRVITATLPPGVTLPAPATAVAQATPTPAEAGPTATSAPVFTPVPVFTPTPVPTPTATPAPQLISAANAANWRLYDEWSAGSSALVLFALGPDGKTVALPKDQGVDIFDVLTGETLQRLQGFIVNRRPLAVAYLQDSVLVQFAEEILRWDIASNSLLEKFSPLPGGDLVVSPSGEWMAVRAKYVTVMNLDTRRAFNVGDENSRQFYQFSPDDRYLALTNGANVQLYSLATGQLERTLFGHGKPTAGLAFTPDGARLISASGDVWDMTDPGATVPVVVFDPALDLQHVAVSPDGQVIVGSDGTVWEAEGGRKIGSLQLGPGQARRVAFTPDGMFVITQLIGDTLQVWAIGAPGAAQTAGAFAAAPPEREPITPFNLARVEPLGQLGSGYESVAFSQDGRTAAGWNRFGGVDILSLASEGTLFSISTSGAISSIAYIGSDFLLIAYQRGRVERWDLSERRLKQTYEAEGAALEVSPDGALFALQGKYIQVIEVLTGKFRHKALGTADSGQDFEFSPDGKLLAIASRQSVGLINMETGQQERILSTHGADPLGLVFTPDGKRLISASGDVWDLTAREAKPIVTFESATNVVGVSPDGALIVGGDGSLWDGNTGQFVGRLPGVGALDEIAFSPNGQYILWHTRSGAAQSAGIRSPASGAPAAASTPDPARESISAETVDRTSLLGWWGTDNLLSVRLLKDAPSGRFAQFGGGHYLSFALHPNGNLLAGVTQSGVELIDLNRGRQVGAFSNLLNPETVLEVAYLGDELMVNKQRAGVERWDLKSGELKQRYNFTGESLVVSPDGEHFALYDGGNVIVVNVESGQAVFSQRAANAQGNFVFSPDGQSLALADGLFAGIWNLETGRRAQNLRGHTQRVTGLAFTPDGQTLVSASGDIWDLESGRLAAEFDTAATRVAVSPDGSVIAANDGGLWETAAGQRIGTLTEMRGAASQLGFGAGGRFLLWRTGNTIYVWGARPAAAPVALPADAAVISAQNVAGLTRKSLWGRGRLASAVWSPDDKYLAVNTTENVIVYEAEGLKQARVVWDATGLAFSSSNQLLIGGAQELQLLDVTTGQTARKFGLTGVNVAAFSPDGRQLGVGGQVSAGGKADGLAVIDLADGLVGVLDDSLGYGGGVTKLEFAADNKTLTAFTYNTVTLSGVISIWDVEKRGRVREPITGVALPPSVSPDGKFIAFFNGRNLIFQTLIQGGPLRSDIREDGTPHLPSSTTIDPLALFDYAYAQDGRLLGFYRTQKGNLLTVVRWNIDPASADVTYDKREYRIDLDNYTGLFADDYTDPRIPLTPFFSLSPTSSRFFSFTADGVVRVWDFNGNEIAASPADYMDVMALSPDGKTAAVPNAVGGIEIVELASGRVAATIPGAWYPDRLIYDSASALVILHGGDKITFWDLKANRLIEEYSGAAFDNPAFFALSPGGQMFAIWVRSASRDFATVFALAPEQPLLDLGRYPKAAPMRFSPDGRYLAVVGGAVVDVWDLQTRQKVEVPGQSRAVGDLAFSADGTRLVSATGEIWEVGAGRLAATFEAPAGLASIALSPNGQVIVGNEGTIWNGANGQPISALSGTRGPALSQTFTADGKQLIRQTKSGVLEVWALP